MTTRAMPPATVFAQRKLAAQQRDRANRAALTASRMNLRRAMQQVAEKKLDEAAKREMAKEHAINPAWPHGIGWAKQSARVVASSSPMQEAQDIQLPPGPAPVAVPTPGPVAIRRGAPMKGKASPGAAVAVAPLAPTQETPEATVVAAREEGMEIPWKWIGAGLAGLWLLRKKK
jgi:hypothetical protein